MPLACFAGGDASSSSPAPATSSSTSVYWTHLGTVTLTWWRGQFGGLLLAAELHLAVAGVGEVEAALRFVLRPWLPWRRRGTKRFVAGAGCGHAVAFSWDMSRARLAGGGRRTPEPVAPSRYSLHVCVDGELVLAAGDLALRSPSTGFLLTRRENAVAGGGEAYATTVAVAGERHEVSIAVEDAGGVMWVAIDGEKALQVRRLRWKFRGSERLDLPAGGRLRVSWDLHGWLFAAETTTAAAAVFVLRFETADVTAGADSSKIDGDAGVHVLRQSSFKRSHHLAAGAAGGGESWRSSDSEMRGWRRGAFRSGSDSSAAVSVASTSAASSAGSVATVAEWATAEEAALINDGGGFSLVVHLWKKTKRR